MLSRIGRLFRRLVNRSEGPPDKPEAPHAEPAAAESPPSVDNTLARDILERMGAITVSRRTIHQARTLPTSGASLQMYFSPAEVRRDVPTTELPLAASRPAFPVTAQETQAPATEHQTFFEGTTGDVAWDTLWKLRGTPSMGAAPGGKAPPEPGDIGERPSSSAPSAVQRASPLPPLARSAQRGSEPAAPQAPTAPPAAQEDAPLAEDVAEPERPARSAPGPRPARPRATLTEIGAAQPPQRSMETPASQPPPDRVPGPVQTRQTEPTSATDGNEVEPVLPETEEAVSERAELDTLQPASEGTAADVPGHVEMPQIGPAGTDAVQAAPAVDRPTAAREPQPPGGPRQRVPEPDLPAVSRTVSTSSSAQPAALDVQPAAPDAQPAVPDVWQAEPGAQPVAPDALSGPVAQAPLSGTQPTMLGAQPTTSDTQPASSAVQPRALDVQPEVPSAELPESTERQETERVPLSAASAGQSLPLVARAPDAKDAVIPGTVVQRAAVQETSPSVVPLQTTEKETQEAFARHPPAPASPPLVPPTAVLEPPVQQAQAELPGAPGFQGRQAPEPRGVEPPSIAGRETEGWMASPPVRPARPTMAQRVIDSREALRQALQPQMVPSVVQAAPQEAEAQTEDTGETAEQEGDQAGQNLDALARDVYRIIRRRLLVERERELGRP